MGFNVNLYTLSKRDNSTKRPTGTGTQYDCVMKHGCGILNPTISLDLGLTNDPSQYNYAYIPTFERYYFIEEWYFEERLWTAQLKVDVLATYKTEIGDASLYVLRASAESNGSITDLLYPARTGCSFASDTKTNPWTGSTFIVGIVSSAGAFGSLRYYAMGSGQLSLMCAGLMDSESIISTANGFNLTDASQALQLSLVDPIQYVKSCVMIPVNITDITGTGSTENVKVYNFTPGGTGTLIIPSSRIYKSYTFTIPNHPDASSRGNYVNSSPFTLLTLTIPPWGCIQIDSSVTANASTLNVDIEVDPITGTGILVLKCNGIVLNRIESQVGVPISLSSVTHGIGGAVASGISALGGASLGVLNAVPMVKEFGETVSAQIGNAINSQSARTQTVGSTGAFVSNRGEFRLDAQFFRPISDDNTHNGRPLCAVRTLKNLGGYMLIQDGDVTINGTSTEDAKIRQYLETGFYYE